jgi:superfamily II DNA/RNA helicase
MPVSSLAVSDILKRNIESRGYKLLMPIQEQAIPAILDGKDVIGIANTGTGKTAAFLIPMVEKIIKNPQYRAIIITPTRELALQIQDELRKITQGLRVYSTFCIGQSSMRNQIMELRRNPHVVIGTPGRLKDLIERKNLNLTRFSMFVLDEVDQMLDMGFARDVKHIISFLPATRQSLFFSATVSPEINTLIQSFVKNPITVSVKRQETVSHIKQETVKVGEGASKIEVLNGLLRKEGFRKVLVFGRTKHGVERLGRNLFEKGFRVSSIHGDKPQVKRQQAIRMFKEDAISILVATDVAARGLDIDNVTHVINYDAPATYEDYIHRIGRTGRANKQGVALTFV